MERLDLFVEKYRLDNTIAGLSVSVTDKNATLSSKGFGVESIERPILTRKTAKSILKMLKEKYEA